MACLGTIFVLTLGIVLVSAGNHNHLRCHSCTGVRDPTTCHHVVECKHPDEVCYTDAFVVGGEVFYQKGCWKVHECPVAATIGRKRAHVALSCENCCATSLCNMNDRCDSYQIAPINGTQPQPTAHVIPGVPAPGDHSQLCTVCHGELDPTICTETHKCHPDQVCYTDVRIFEGRNYFFKGCTNPHTCSNVAAAVGKRGAHLPHEKDLALLCDTCCVGSMCNQQNTQCDSYMNSATTMAPITTQGPVATQAPTTALPLCRDHEEDGFNCSTYDQYNFCAVTDPTALSYDIAHKKCPDHCGFCNPTVATTTAPPVVTADPCMDHEEDGFRCADYDQYNFCTDTSSIAYMFAHQKCPKHCNFCQPGGTTASGVAASVTLTSTHQAGQPVVTTSAPTIGVVTQLVQGGSTGRPCQDFEDASFSCASWASNGFCTSPTGVLHEITVMRCSKYCGLCT